MSKKSGISQSLLLLSWGAITGSMFALILATDIFELQVANNLFTNDIHPGWAAVLGAVLSGTISVILFLAQRNADLNAERKRVALRHYPVKFIISDIESSFREITINLENLLGPQNKQVHYNFEAFINVFSGIQSSAYKLGQRTRMLQAYDGREYGPDFSDAVKKLLEFSESVLAATATAKVSLDDIFARDVHKEVPKDAIKAVEYVYYLVVRDKIYPDIARSEVEWVISTATA